MPRQQWRIRSGGTARFTHAEAIAQNLVEDTGFTALAAGSLEVRAIAQPPSRLNRGDLYGFQRGEFHEK